jgi:ketosteroid isomerase-like protein
MIRKISPFVLLVSTLILSSCSTTPSDPRPAAEAAIRTADQQWSATAAKNDLDGTVSYYADDAVLLPPNAPIARDKTSIRNTWANLLGPGTSVTWQTSNVEAAKSGEIGYAYGTYSTTTTAGAAPETGKFVEVWKKQPNGNWKCIVDTYNPDAPATPPPAPARKAPSKTRTAHHRRHHPTSH